MIPEEPNKNHFYHESPPPNNYNRIIEIDEKKYHHSNPQTPTISDPPTTRKTTTTTTTCTTTKHLIKDTINNQTSNTNCQPHKQEEEFTLKLVLIGDSGVGKSNLVLRFIRNHYQENSTQTVGFEFAIKKIRVGDRIIKAQIWDTAGLERFQSLTAAYYRNAVGAMVVYDITSRSSFENLEKWMHQIRENTHKDLVLLLVGNKSDLAHLPNTRKVSTLEAAKFAEKHSMEFMETSALDATNVLKAFKKIIYPLGRILSPNTCHQVIQLPPGWRRVSSRTRPGEYSYENKYTKERIAFVPKEPAKPSQYNFHVAHDSSSIGVTVTKDQISSQHPGVTETECGCTSCMIL